MKKLSLFLPVLLVIMFAVSTGFANPTFQSISTESSSVTFYAMDAAPAPFGFQKVEYDINTEERGRKLYMKAFGTLEGYSLEAADRITAYIPVGARPDCDCTTQGFCLRAVYTPLGGWDCVNTCPPSCMPQSACAP